MTFTFGLPPPIRRRDLSHWGPPSGTFVLCAVFASALLINAAALLGQTSDPAGATAETDLEKRMQWLNSRVPPKPLATPKTAAPKIGFRTNPQAIGTRPVEASPAETRPPQARPAPTPAVATHTAETPPPVKKLAEATPAKTKTVEARSPKVTPAPIVKQTTPAVVPSPSPAKKRTAETHVATPNPTPVAQTTPLPKATPLAIAKLTTPPAIAPPKIHPPEPPTTPAPKLTQTTSITFIPASTPAPKVRPKESPEDLPKGRYAWKTNIVTTVFWVGEPPSGNNFTPNRSSSWDAHWTQNYGGFDNPDPVARRNFIPARFTPRQNPFYVALPYNDVTHGTTKPEARKVIPWFRSAFVREGQSVCHDRWVAIRSQSGKIVYAQWSDCGPFRTDHWQYVFGNERPKPNLNRGAGLDVSPAVRDYLGLDGTDLTDWKFVEFREVPFGPWARYGTNNTFVRK